MTHPLWRPAEPLLLASGSPTRRDLLASAGLPVETCPADIDERAVEAQAGALPPPALALRLAAVKAQAVAARHPGRIVLGADQVLDLDGTLFHKPADAAAAAVHLARLQGRTHALHAAVALVHEGRVETFLETARLTMRPLDTAAIDTYLRIAGPAVTRSVGAYQLEGAGIHLFARVEGDHSTVLGLPLLPLLERLRAGGLLTF
ncbi:Maf family protein [Methylobacterium sp. Leaf118]|uniref:Maf family protein n=1 Tax=Methylobacterium sp. Leaf118 TaxID=2876562 RepID=UPI001E601918|nr:Maf family nucleotide pyrophosphatase [Methylobacterium sp. Leaf118]